MAVARHDRNCLNGQAAVAGAPREPRKGEAELADPAASSTGASGGRESPVVGVEQRDGACVVSLTGELDLYNAELVRAALLECCADEPALLVVDLEQVKFIDSTALGVLIEARSRMANRSAFRLAAPGLETRRALEVSGLDRHFSVHETTDDALAAPL